MGLLEAALQKLSNPSSSLAMAEDTYRDLRHRQNQVADDNANRVERMWDTVEDRSQAEQKRKHEAGLQDDRLAQERELFQKGLSFEGQQNRLDRMHELELHGSEQELRMNLAELQREHELLMQKEQNQWTAQDHALQRDLEWRIAKLREEIEKARLSAQFPESAEQGDVLANYFREVEKLRQTGYEWQWDNVRQRYVYAGEQTEADLMQQLFRNIDSDSSYSPAERDELKTFIQDNIGRLILSEGGGGGGEDQQVVGPRTMDEAVRQSQQAVEEAGALHWMPTDPSPDGRTFQDRVGEVAERLTEPMYNRYTDAIRGGSLEDRRTRVELRHIIDRLRTEDLSPAEQEVLDYAEAERSRLERNWRPGYDPTPELRKLIELLEPLGGDEKQDTTYVPGIPQGYGNYGRE